MPGENSKPMEWTTIKTVKIMRKSAYQAMAKPAVKKTEAAKPAESKPAETKSSMGGGTGMDMNAGQSTSSGQSQGSTQSSNQSSGHPGHDTVEKAKDVTQPTTPPSTDNQGGGESGN